MKKEVKAPILKHILLVVIGIVLFLATFYFKVHVHHQVDATGTGLMRAVKRLVAICIFCFIFSYIFGSLIVSQKEARKISWIDIEDRYPEASFVSGSILLGSLLATLFILMF